MLNIKQLRHNTKSIASALKKRGFFFDTKQFNELEQQRKSLQVLMQDLQNERNTLSKSISKAKTSGEDIAPLLTKATNLGTKLDNAKSQLRIIQTQLDEILLSLPNTPHASVPSGSSENDNIEIAKWGKPTQFAFTPKNHIDLGANYGLDFETAAKISGSRFSLMTGFIAKLHRALGQFMLDQHTQINGYTETYVPYLVSPDCLLGTGQLPKFEADLFKTHLHGEANEAKTLYLIPTAEVPLTNIMRDCIIKDSDLPLKFTAHTPCFRSEAGAYGRDAYGLIRQHQFEKVELVQITKAGDSYQALEALTKHAENILRALKLPYRKVELCAGDLGFSAAKTFDLEVWLPAQNTYREVSSCSCFEDFQTRRLQIRRKNPVTKQAELLHTVNGSGLAVGRTLAAVLENYQNADGSIKIPPVLHSYMDSKTHINSQ